MKCALLSDLHIEWVSGEFSLPDADVLCLVGDIISFSPQIFLSSIEESAAKRRFFELLNSATSKYKFVFYVPGNHEYYGTTFDDAKRQLQDLMSTYNNLVVLDNDRFVVDDVQFLGSTLWSSLNNRHPLTVIAAQQFLNDYSNIQKDPATLATVDDFLDLHDKSVQWFNTVLNDSVTQNVNKTIVLTHYAPSFSSVNPRFVGDPSTGAFCSDLDNLILHNTCINVWAHGHTHWNVDYMLGSTRVLSNQKGSNRESISNMWRPNFTFEI